MCIRDRFNSGGNFALDASENFVNVKSSEKLWSFVNPKKSSPPETIDSNWARGNIDRFILHKLEENGLEPEKEAIPEVIIRRLFFDLLGMPPSFSEIEKYKNFFQNYSELSNIDNVELLKMNAEDLDFESSTKFDIVIGGAILHHINYQKTRGTLSMLQKT